MTSNLPSGTVTFLFTDIEGSTKLWEMYPEAMKTALEKHDSVLRRTVESCGGHLIKSTGDGIHAAFESVTDGLRATIVAQRALGEEPWDEIKPHTVKVRMGLHTGEAQLRAGDYFGSALNRAARLMSAGHGGQILVSNASAELLHDRLPPDTTLRDLGEHRLKDLVRSEHVYQAIHPSLAASFPALQTLDSFPNNLPVQLTSFVGRANELVEARQQLSSTRLLSLVGSGGTGKTRFSLQLAAELVGSYPDGVWFVELAPLSDAALIAESIAAVVGIREQVGMPVLGVLTDYFRAKRILLILDNCEHLVEACARLADHFLHACPHVKIIASSREALSIRGETVHRVPSLTLPADAQITAGALSGSEAVQLFLERAQALTPDFTITDANASNIARICRRLDGIPLALELAAARVAVFSPEQIASRLTDRFKLLTGGGRTTVPRQQTLRATIDWSYEILSEPEQSLLRRLAVFAGTWTFEAAEVICPGLDVLELLTQLVNKSLVIAEGDGSATRYRLLESIRDYGRERAVQVGNWEELRQAHLAYYAGLADLGSTKVLGPEVFEWLPRLRADYDNLRAALEWGLEHDPERALRLAGALSSFWWRCGQSAEGTNWISQALARAEGLPQAQGDARRQQLALCQRAWYGMGMLAYLNDDPIALKAAETCAALSRELEDPRTLSICLAVIGWEQMILGDNPAALEAIGESLKLARATGDRHSQGFALAAMAWYDLTVEHDLDAARLNETQSIDLLEGGELSWEGLQLVFGPARGAMLRGEFAAARERFAKYLPLFEKLGDEHRVNMIRSWLAHMERYEGRYERAAQQYRDTILMWQKLGHRGAIAHQLESFAFVALALKQDERAGRLLGAAEALRDKVGSPMSPQERVEHDQFVADLRGRMDQLAFASAWSAGRVLTMEQAISYAVTGSHL